MLAHLFDDHITDSAIGLENDIGTSLATNPFLKGIITLSSSGGFRGQVLVLPGSFSELSSV